VAYRDGPFENLRAPIWLTAAFAVIVAGAAAILLLLSDKRDAQKGVAAPMKSSFDTAAAPINGVLAAPVRAVGGVSDFFSNWFDAANENARLKKKIADLEAVRDNAIALKNINARYEALLNIRVQPPVEMATARSVSESRGPFANARLIDAGSDKGIKVGNPVINEHGLIGRVVGVSGGVSRVLLLTDVSSRTPVLIDRTDARAILTGDGGSNPRLDFLRGNEQVKEGDRILTSGDGGMLPRGLPVGVAAKALDGSWRVKLFSDQGDLDYVRVLLFQDFSQLLKPDSLNAPPLASLATAPQPSPDLAARIDALHPVRTFSSAPSSAAPSAAASAPTVMVAPPPKAAAKAAATDASAADKAPAKKSDKASTKSSTDAGTPKLPFPYNGVKSQPQGEQP
jgi:rod shape-determining protein MreC